MSLVDLGALVVAAWLAVGAAGATLIWAGSRASRARRRRRARAGQRPLTDREVAQNARPNAAPILIAPARAPRNGSHHDTT